MSAQPRRQILIIDWPANAEASEAAASAPIAEVVQLAPRLADEAWVERALVNAAWTTAVPVLSVLIPFYRDDPCDLITALEREGRRMGGSVELVLLDDGSADETLARKVENQIALAHMPARFVRLRANEGRAKGRNRLVAHARGSSYLFLDADMRPDDDRFLRSWADLVAMKDPAVAFGGFSLKQSPKDAKFNVHRRMAAKAECVPFFQRALTPEKYVYTSNLLVRRDAFAAEAFDDAFIGWGWEDVEWAMRVASRFTVIHVDNAASHLGLGTVADLARKYEQSVWNFSRVVMMHHEIVSTYPSYRVAKTLKALPLRGVWRALFKGVALLPVLPSKARAFALRLYRASLYAEAV